MRLLVRLLAATAVTILAAVLLYFIFLHDERPNEGDGQRPHQPVNFRRSEIPSLSGECCPELHMRRVTEIRVIKWESSR
jgi:hypothetical protein